MLCVNVLRLLFSAVAAHTELVRTLTTAPPAKRQPASSTGNLIQIMSLLHYTTHQTQPILSWSSSNSPEISPIAICAPFVFPQSSQVLSLIQHIFCFCFIFISSSSQYPAVSALFSLTDNITSYTVHPII